MIDARMRRDFAVISGLRGFFELDAFLLFKTLRELNFHSDTPVLEVGVFCGRSLTALACLYPDVKVHGVDPFYADFGASPAFADEAGLLADKSAGQTPEARIAAIEETLAALDKQNGTSIAENLVLHRTTESEFLAANDEHFQLIHIDAEHTFQAVTASLDALPQTLVPDGWLVLDDFLNPGFPDISEAVHAHRLFRRGLWPVVYGANKAAFLYSESQEPLVRELRERIAARYRDLGAVVRAMHDGASMVDIPGLGRPVKRKKTMAGRLKRLVGLGP